MIWLLLVFLSAEGVVSQFSRRGCYNIYPECWRYNQAYCSHETYQYWMKAFCMRFCGDCSRPHTTDSPFTTESPNFNSTISYPTSYPTPNWNRTTPYPYPDWTSYPNPDWNRTTSYPYPDWNNTTSYPTPVWNRTTDYPIRTTRNPGGCGGYLRGRNGSIESPNYPQNYNVDQICHWTISVNDDETVEIMLEDLDLESASTCGYDYLEIRECCSAGYNRRLGKYCGKTQNVVVKSKDSKVKLTFRSDISVTRKGFLLKWKAVKRITTPDGVYKDCKSAMLHNKRYLSTFTIKPDADSDSFVVNCYRNGNKYITEVPHNYANDSLITDYEAPLSYVGKLHYHHANNASNIIEIPSLKALVDQAQSCAQYVRIICHNAIYTDSGVRDRNGNLIPYFAGGNNNSRCACGITGSCYNVGKECNCDCNCRSTLQDEGYYTQKNLLPLQAVLGGDTGHSSEWLTFRVGNLICWDFKDIGQWSNWGGYEACPATCQVDPASPPTQTRSRTCNNVTFGAYCPGRNVDSRPCNVNITCPAPTPQPSSQPTTCGRSTVVQSRIINGVNATPGAWPWIASLQRYGSHYCGGTLLTPKWVLTASHCVSRIDSSNMRHWTIKLGAHNHNRLESSVQRYDIKRVIMHPDYTRSTLKADMAMLELERPAILNDRVRLACLPRKDVYPPIGKQCYLAGWGSINYPGGVHPILQQTRLPVVSGATCGGIDEVVCVGNGFKNQPNGKQQPNACRGDSGGPLVCQQSDGRWQLEGVASYVYTYCKYYTAYSPVNKYLDWIISFLK